jgi:hypothetical protein
LWPFSETHLKAHERFFILNFHLYRTDRYPGRKGGTAVAVRKGIPHNHVNLPTLVSVEVTGVCIPLAKSEVLLAAVYKSPGRAWSEADITELLSFGPKSILAGDMNAKTPFWKSEVSNHSGEKLLHLFHVNQFEISAPECPTHYSPSGNGDMLDILAHQNSRMSDVIFSDILDSDHLPKIFHILDYVKFRNLSDPMEKFTDWDRFQSLASEFISLKIEITSEAEADKAARDFTASISSAYRLSTSKITLLYVNNDLAGLYRLLKHKQRLRKLWQETRDPASKTTVNWVSKAIRRMTRKKALERFENKNK